VSEKPWGGRFSEKTLAAVEAFTESISFDARLGRQDVTLSIAHAQMLAEVGLITSDEGDQLACALEEIGSLLENGSMPFKTELEDIHMHIECALIERLGDLGRKIHTARSRNDQVATAFRMWTREALDRTVKLIENLQNAFVTAAEDDGMMVMPGYTHLQRAQPILAAHSYLAHVERLERDRGRLLDARKRTNILPLGCAALAGTSLPIDRMFVANKLKFDGVARNSLDATSDRDFAIEAACALSLVANHLSSWAEEWILWSTAEFDFIALPDRLCTGSSIMPQKKNPDVLELIRGRSGRTIGSLTQLLVLTKGLPLAYNRDLQEDKLALFSAFDSVEACLAMATLVVQGAKLKKEVIASRLEYGFLDATTLMELLIKEKVPMRMAHEIVGRLVREAESQGVSLSKLSNEALQAAHPVLTKSKAASVLGTHNAVEAFVSEGSTGPQKVREMLQSWKTELASRPH
jgi:argininosuccinate lyase